MLERAFDAIKAIKDCDWLHFQFRNMKDCNVDSDRQKLLFSWNHIALLLSWSRLYEVISCTFSVGEKHQFAMRSHILYTCFPRWYSHTIYNPADDPRWKGKHLIFWRLWQTDGIFDRVLRGAPYFRKKLGFASERPEKAYFWWDIVPQPLILAMKN